MVERVQRNLRANETIRAFRIYADDDDDIALFSLQQVVSQTGSVDSRDVEERDVGATSHVAEVDARSAGQAHSFEPLNDGKEPVLRDAKTAHLLCGALDHGIGEGTVESLEVGPPYVVRCLRSRLYQRQVDPAEQRQL